MKNFILGLFCAVTAISAEAQAPGRMYGEYQYAYSIDTDGDIIERTAFPRIKPIVVTTNFGFVQSSASYLYMGAWGEWLNSAEFSWAGFQNGWYVYAYRLGQRYSYFLISKNLYTVRIQESNSNGITDVYTQCDPDEKMNSAPTY